MDKVGNPDKEKAFGNVKVLDDRMVKEIDRANRELDKAKSRSKEKPMFKVEGLVTDLWKCSTGVVAMLVLLGVLAANTELGKYFESGGTLGGMMSATGNALGFAPSSPVPALAVIALIALALVAFRKRRK